MTQNAAHNLHLPYATIHETQLINRLHDGSVKRKRNIAMLQVETRGNFFVKRKKGRSGGQ